MSILESTFPSNRLSRPPFAKLLYRHLLWRLNGFIRHEVTERYEQGVFTMSLQDHGLSARMYRHRQHEFQLSLLVVDFLKKHEFIPVNGGTMIDVGANIGPICIGLLNAGEIMSAIAIEPEPQNFALLKRNIAQNHLENKIIAKNVALGESEGELIIKKSKNNYGDHRTSVPNEAELNSTDHAAGETIQCLVLSDYCSWPMPNNQPSVSFLWIDVQGYEGYVFSGGGDLLDKGTPTVAEVWPKGIKEAGMTLERFAQIITKRWNRFWLLNKEKHFSSYAISQFPDFLNELDRTDSDANVIFTV